MDRRDYIVSKAAELICSRGYENTTVNDILDAAQISKGQFYHYFSTKHELGIAVIDYLFEGWNKRLLEDILSKPNDPEERLNEMLQWIVNQHTLNQAKWGCPFGNLAIEMSPHDEAFRQKLHGVFELWIAKIKQLLDEMIEPAAKEFPGATQKCAEVIVAMIEGGILIMKSKQDIRVLVNMTEMIKETVSHFVKAHSA